MVRAQIGYTRPDTPTDVWFLKDVSSVLLGSFLCHKIPEVLRIELNEFRYIFSLRFNTGNNNIFIRILITSKLANVLLQKVEQFSSPQTHQLLHIGNNP